jgi:Flp pilus assembly pilin Flp
LHDLLIVVAVRLHNTWFRARDDESGQGLVEYALIVAVVSLGLIMALTFLKRSIAGLFSKAGNSLGDVHVG